MNCIRSTSSLDLKSLKCFEVTLKRDYETVKRRLHGIIRLLIKEERIATYELQHIGKEAVKAWIYFRDSEDEAEIKRRIFDIIHGEPKYVEKTPDSSGMENLFDAMVSVALEEEGLRHAGGKYVDVKRDICIKKKTVLDHEGRFLLFLDYTRLAPSIADEILEELKVKGFWKIKEDESLREKALEQARKYVGKVVFTWVKERGVWGKITGVENSFVGDKIINGKHLHEIWRGREIITGIEVDENEYPVFKVDIGGKEWFYPPSVLRPPKTVADPPDTRLKEIDNYIEKLKNRLEGLLIKLGYNNVKFEFVYVENVFQRPNFYYKEDKIDKESVVKLVYGGNCDEGLPQSPLFAFTNKGCQPYAGKQELNLVLIHPSNLNVEKIVELEKNIRRKFEELNLGSIEKIEELPYFYNPNNLSKSQNSLENIIAKCCDSHSPSNSFLVVIIPEDERFYISAKSEASKKGYHTQLIRTSKLKEVGEDSKLINICGGIYVDFLIQKKIAEGKPAGPLTWKLSSPADGKEKSIYIGFDISRKRGVAGAAFILFDPYGELVDARMISLTSETIGREQYRDVFRRVVEKAKERSSDRIVIMRDGPPKSGEELEGCLEVFNEVTEELGYRPSLEYISVIKTAPIRIFKVDGSAQNPIQGTYCYLHGIKHFNKRAYEVIVVSTKPKEKCAKPVLLRIYEVEGNLNEKDEEDIKRIAEEYLSLTRLNFWNLETGASRLALPIKMADVLSYMKASGIPVKPE